MFVCKACGGMLNLESRACPQCGREADDAWFLSARGEKCFEDLNYPGSAHEFANAARLAPGDARIGRGLAHAHFHSGSVAEAESRYRRLLASDPDNPECLFNLGQILTGQGELDEAKTLLERLIRIPCEFTSGEFYLGLLFKEAVHFKADCHFHLAMVYWNRGDPSSSHRHLEIAAEINPSQAFVCRHLATLKFLAKEYQEVVKYCRRYLKLRDRVAREPLQTLHIYRKLRIRNLDITKPAEMGIEFDRLTRDSLMDVRYKLGTAYFELEDFEAASEEFQQVLRTMPGHHGAIYQMNLIYQREGRYSNTESIRPKVFKDLDFASIPFGLTRPKPPREGSPYVSEPEKDVRPIIGKSLAMQRVLRSARLAATSNATVLVIGENGTGKELIARAIHQNSSRRDHPFVAVHCAAIPENLLESELFGHERGAFTGATHRRIGRFEAAHSGTIFLDEIAELTQAMQVKLLRFLQEREISRVGGNETISVDVRIIAATNANLEELVARGVFRTDLYYRLHVLPVRVPPLRERREDIPLLVDHFIQKYSKQTLRREALLQPYEMKVLQEYDWPGNVRELENIIERAMVMGTQVEKILRGIAELRRQKSRAESALAPNVIELRPAGRGEAPRPPGEDQSQHAFYTPATLEDLERRHIVETLKYTGGNRGEAARILGINPATLWRKMKSYQIADPKAEESS